MSSIVFTFAYSLSKKMILGSLRVYQKTFSPDHGIARFLYPGGYCKFKPTCSEYAYQAVDELGIFRGLFLSARRIMRCNPWSRGGLDQVPKRKS